MKTDRLLIVDSPMKKEGQKCFSVGKAVCCNDDHMLCPLLFNDDCAVMETTFRHCMRCTDSSSLSRISVIALQSQIAAIAFLQGQKGCAD
jgi:hypothetical protein